MGSCVVAVLAGGRGERIGGCKPLAMLAGRPLLAYPLAAARAAGLEAFVVAKRRSALPALAHRVVHEPEEPTHPLTGIVAALAEARSRSPSPAVIALACDMPFVSPALLARLASLSGAAMAQRGGRPQPALVRLESAHLPALRSSLSRREALTEALCALSPLLLGEQDIAHLGDPARLLFNVNTRADLARAEAMLPSAGAMLPSAEAMLPSAGASRAGAGPA